MCHKGHNLVKTQISFDEEWFPVVATSCRQRALTNNFQCQRPFRDLSSSCQNWAPICRLNCATSPSTAPCGMTGCWRSATSPIAKHPGDPSRPSTSPWRSETDPLSAAGATTSARATSQRPSVSMTCLLVLQLSPWRSDKVRFSGFSHWNGTSEEEAQLLYLLGTLIALALLLTPFLCFVFIKHRVSWIYTTSITPGSPEDAK